MRIVVVCWLLAAFNAWGVSENPDPALLKEVHFLIPAGPGGGWDGTARGVGRALKMADLVEKVTFENAAGGGGGRAIAKLIETGSQQPNTLLISVKYSLHTGVHKGAQIFVQTKFAIRMKA